MTDSPPPRLLRAVASDALPGALGQALAGGDPIAPLPPPGPERSAALTMLGLDQPVVEPDAVAVVATSGSTGEPKGVVLSRSAIAASAAASHDRLGGPGDWVLALPGHYVAGLMVLARCALARTTAHRIPPNLIGLATVVDRMRGRRYLSLVPTQLVRACADEELATALARFDAVLLGGAAADAGLLELARERGIAVVTTYGMSETCGGCVYDGVPLDGVSVDLESATSRIRISGPMLFSGYRLRPDLTAAALSAAGYRSQDRGRWHDGRLSVAGRLDDVVVSGGINVDLAAVESAARAWPGLRGAEIAVVGVPSPVWGTEVVAVTDGLGTLDQLRDYLRQRLPSSAVPRRLARVDALPRTSSGKTDRQRLVAELSAAAVQPRSDSAGETLGETPAEPPAEVGR